MKSQKLKFFDKCRSKIGHFHKNGIFSKTRLNFTERQLKKRNSAKLYLSILSKKLLLHFFQFSFFFHLFANLVKFLVKFLPGPLRLFVSFSSILNMQRFYRSNKSLKLFSFINCISIPPN